MESDPQLPQRGREGTENAALVDLALRYSAALTRYFRRRIGPETDVADLVQDVFLRLVKLRRPNEIQNAAESAGLAWASELAVELLYVSRSDGAKPLPDIAKWNDNAPAS